MSRPRSLPSSRRCEASSRCTPSDRPSRPIMTNRSMNSGRAESSSENSSMTTNSVGTGGRPRRSLAGPVVVAQRGVVARRAQQLLPADQLAVQRVAHPVHQRQLVGQVGDHGGDVGQPVQAEEGRAALEVHQDEVEHVGGMGQGQAEHQRPEQLGLARAGRADDQAVRAHAALRGLLDVQLDGLARRRRCRSAPAAGCAAAAAATASGTSSMSGLGDAEQRRQRGVGRQRVVGRAADAGPQRRELPGEGVGLGQRQRVGDADRRARLGAGPVPG